MASFEVDTRSSTAIELTKNGGFKHCLEQQQKNEHQQVCQIFVSVCMMTLALPTQVKKSDQWFATKAAKNNLQQKMPKTSLSCGMLPRALP